MSLLLRLLEQLPFAFFSREALSLSILKAVLFRPEVIEQVVLGPDFERAAPDLREFISRVVQGRPVDEYSVF
jgi:hypothetical protein